MVDAARASGVLNQARVAKSSALVKKLGTVVYRWELARQLDSKVEQLAAAQQLAALQQAGLQWYHEQLLPRDPATKLAEPVR